MKDATIGLALWCALGATAAAGERERPPRVRQVVAIDVPVLPAFRSLAFTRAGLDASGNAIVVSGEEWQRVDANGAVSAAAATAGFFDVAFEPDGVVDLVGRVVSRISPAGATVAMMAVDPLDPDDPPFNSGIAARDDRVDLAYVRDVDVPDGTGGSRRESRLFVRRMSTDLAPLGDPIDVTPSSGLSIGGPRVGIGPDGATAVVFESMAIEPPLVCTVEGCAYGWFPDVSFVDVAGAVVRHRRPVAAKGQLTTSAVFLDDGSAWVAHAGSDGRLNPLPSLSLGRFAVAEAGSRQLVLDDVAGRPDETRRPIALAADSDGAACTVIECLTCPRPFRPSVAWRRTSRDGASTIMRRLSATRWSPGVALAVSRDGTSLVAASQSDGADRSRIVAVALDRRGRITRRLAFTWAYDVGAPLLVAAQFGGPVRFAMLWSARAVKDGAARSFLALVE
jgi:hypothetical protein